MFIRQLVVPQHRIRVFSVHILPKFRCRFFAGVSKRISELRDGKLDQRRRAEPQNPDNPHRASIQRRFVAACHEATKRRICQLSAV